MYTVKGKMRKVRGVDGVLRTESKPDVTFHTAAGLLRWALNTRQLEHRTGGRPYPTRFDDKWLGDPDDTSRGSAYGIIDSFSRYEWTPELRQAMQRAAWRYREIVRYLREVEPEWKPDTSVSPSGEIHWADNSIERQEINKYGKTRIVRLKAPSGDACF